MSKFVALVAVTILLFALWPPRGCGLNDSANPFPYTPPDTTAARGTVVFAPTAGGAVIPPVVSGFMATPTGLSGAVANGSDFFAGTGFGPGFGQ